MRPRMTSRSEMVTLFLNSEHARDLFLVSIPMFIGIGNYLGPFLISL